MTTGHSGGKESAPAKVSKRATRRKSDWRKVEVERAIAAAEQAGLESYRLEIEPNGTISIIVGESSGTALPDAPDRPLRP